MAKVKASREAGIAWKDENFNVLLRAMTKKNQIVFSYKTDDGKERERVGFVSELTNEYVLILDVVRDGPRRANFTHIIPPVRNLR